MEGEKKSVRRRGSGAMACPCSGLAVLKAGLLTDLIYLYPLIPFLTPMLPTRRLALAVFPS